jgi:hypothetical protein
MAIDIEAPGADEAALIAALAALLGDSFQPKDADLTAIAALSTTAYGRAFLALANEAALAALLTNSYQGKDAELTALAGLTSAADKLAYFTGSGTAALADFSSYGRTLANTASLAALRATLTRNIVRATRFTAFSTTAQIPTDNSIPLIGEGDEILTAEITPTSTTSWIRAVALIHLNFSGAGTGTAAMFIEGASNAVAANYVSSASASTGTSISLDYQYIPGTLNPQTVAVRVGPNASVTLRANSVGTDIFGGVSHGAVLTIEEIHV